MSSSHKDRVLVQLPGGVAGPFLVSRLRQVKGFTLQTLVSFPGTDKWAPAFRVLALKTYFEGDLDIQSDSNPGFPLPVFTPKAAAKRIELPAVFFGKVEELRSFTDRWFPRVAVLNLIVAVVVAAGWTIQPLHKSLQKSFMNFMAPPIVAPTVTLLDGPPAKTAPAMVKKIAAPSHVVNVSLYHKKAAPLLKPLHHVPTLHRKKPSLT